jgi:hypothetical protein
MSRTASAKPPPAEGESTRLDERGDELLRFASPASCSADARLRFEERVTGPLPLASAIGVGPLLEPSFVPRFL